LLALTPLLPLPPLLALPLLAPEPAPAPAPLAELVAGVPELEILVPEVIGSTVAVCRRAGCAAWSAALVRPVPCPIPPEQDHILRGEPARRI
jgi:hypothetical protein